MAETQLFIDKSIGKWRHRLKCTSLDGATLFYKVGLNKLVQA